jgi:hypothetical protein
MGSHKVDTRYHDGRAIKLCRYRTFWYASICKFATLDHTPRVPTEAVVFEDIWPLLALALVRRYSTRYDKAGDIVDAVEEAANNANGLSLKTTT